MPRRWACSTRRGTTRGSVRGAGYPTMQPRARSRLAQSYSASCRPPSPPQPVPSSPQLDLSRPQRDPSRPRQDRSLMPVAPSSPHQAGHKQTTMTRHPRVPKSPARVCAARLGCPNPMIRGLAASQQLQAWRMCTARVRLAPQCGNRLEAGSAEAQHSAQAFKHGATCTVPGETRGMELRNVIGRTRHVGTLLEAGEKRDWAGVERAAVSGPVPTGLSLRKWWRQYDGRQDALPDQATTKKGRKETQASSCRRWRYRAAF